jgi:hypothetical protein
MNRAEQVPAVSEALAPIERHDRPRLRRLLDPEAARRIDIPGSPQAGPGNRDTTRPGPPGRLPA